MRLKTTVCACLVHIAEKLTCCAWCSMLTSGSVGGLSCRWLSGTSIIDSASRTASDASSKGRIVQYCSGLAKECKQKPNTKVPHRNYELCTFVDFIVVGAITLWVKKTATNFLFHVKKSAINFFLSAIQKQRIFRDCAVVVNVKCDY